MRLLSMLNWIISTVKKPAAVQPAQEQPVINGAKALTSAQMATITSTVEANIVVPGAVDAKAFGAIGDGSFHAISSGQIAAWGVGAWASPGDSVDWVGIMRCVYDAYGTDPTNTVYKHDVFIPAGHYKVNKPVTLIGKGRRIRGDEREASIIETTSTTTPAIFCNYFSYGTIEHLTAWGTDGGTAAIVIDADGTYDNVLLKVQQLTIESLTIDARNGNYGLDVLPVGIGSGQGDTIQMRSCFAGNAKKAGIRLSGDNLLAFMFIGGNIQSCLHDGIAVYGAQVFVDGTSFQASHPLQVLSSGGADVHCYGGPSVTTIHNIRSENVVGCIDQGGNAVIDTCQLYSVLNSPYQWTANTAVSQGELFIASDASGYKDGRLWICTKAGTTGSIEPAWALANGSVKSDTADWTVGNPTVTLTSGIPNLPSNAIGPTGWTAILGTGGAGGAPLYTTLVSQGPPVLADNPVSANEYPGNGILIVGQAIVDGTAEWVQWEFDAYHGGRINAVAANYGRVKAAVITNSSFNRLDYMDSHQFGTGSPGDWAVGVSGLYANNGASAANEWFSGTLMEHSASGDPSGFQAMVHFCLRSALLFMAGANNNMYPDVGVFRGDASFTPSDHKNILAVIGDGLGKITKVSADTTGDDLNLIGGLGTGVGGGGAVKLWIQGPTSSGTSVPTPTAVVAAELPAGTDTALLVYTNGALKRVHVGAADSGGTGQRLLTVDN